MITMPDVPIGASGIFCSNYNTIVQWDLTIMPNDDTIYFRITHGANCWHRMHCGAQYT